MRLLGRKPPSPAIVVAGAAVVFALVGSAVAGTDSLTGKLDKTEKKQVKKISVKQANTQIDARAPGLSVNRAETANSARSADHAATATSAARAENVLSAAVNPDGTLARAGQGNTTSTRTAPGQYEVDFGRDVSNCVWVAGISSVTAPAVAGQAQVGPRTGNAEAIFVLTTDSGGAITDRPFHVVVVC
jgi:hypothetical protein